MRAKRIARFVTVGLVLLAPVMTDVPAHAASTWSAKEPVLSTPWTHEVGPANALPEYPRPQMARSRWQNLNGVWDYAGRPAADVTSRPPAPADYREQILVPYPPESALSGVERHDDQMWYRRTFRVPDGWADQRVLLHFGAVDQVATVWVNDRRVAHHEGGYTAFSADITSALRPSGLQELTVRVEDRNDTNPFPVGKQSNRPKGLFYTGASGIWQTVWMEPVPAAHIDKLDITADLTSFAVRPKISGAGDQRVEVTVAAPQGKPVASKSGMPGETIRIAVPKPRLWTPDDPYLYDVTVRLVDAAGDVVDEVSSYGGLRTIGTVDDARGRSRIALNDKIVFLHGPLDQGYWPDGIYTAPTDAALRFDLEQTKALGFNFVRKHIKVEPARWYYWADKLGLLVWQDMPSLPLTASIEGVWGPAPDPELEAQVNYESGLAEMVDQLRNVTSIVAWVPFNEGWGEFDTARIANAVKAMDATRMVVPNSGTNCCQSRTDTGAGDVYDDHTYVGPGRPEVDDGRVTVNGEYGGLGLVVEQNRWPGPPMAYEMTDSKEQLTKRYVEVSLDLEHAIHTHGLSGAIYTQTTDVENEVNGYLTYDRRVMKPDLGVVAERNRAVIAAGSR
ncbi:glycoside hydrolase family 2 protein [Mycolicibacterium sp. XJ1819]